MTIVQDFFLAFSQLNFFFSDMFAEFSFPKSIFVPKKNLKAFRKYFNEMFFVSFSLLTN